tara:strand:- start:3454 stop:3954 length:501 start_codon:yes stop_codon:yes gene_type:complete
MKKLSLSLLFVFISFSSFGQNTLKLGDNKSPKATLADIAWLSGHWRGEAFGGIIEEIWSPPLGDSMMGSFKLVSEGKTAFYEICQLVEENGSLSFRLKHFNGDLTGWEEKNEREEFPLVKVEKDAVYFDDFTIKRISENEIYMYVVISDEGEPEEVEFKYIRFNMK